jgi:hypothetical protein
MPGLTDRLRSARADLLNEIKVPELGAVRSRAHRIRRRRRGLQATAGALALVAVVGAGAAITRNGPWSRPEPVASAGPTASPAAATVWRGGGLTINGLEGPHLDLPGTLVDVQFAEDENLAYALAADCPEGGAECGIALAASTNGGQSWRTWTSPVTVASSASLPRLITVGTVGVALLDADGVGYYSPADRPEWTPLPLPATAIDRLAIGARMTVSEPAQPHQCDDLTVLVLQPEGTSARLGNPPDLRVCGMAPARAADASLWVAGRTDSGPAVAVSWDDGYSWTVRTLPGGGASQWAQVATVGSQVYATVVSPRSGTMSALTVEGVFRATTADADFQPYAGKIGTVDGEVMPLMDGRLVAAGPNWYVSQEGATMRGAGGTLPWVRRILRSPGGWVAYNLFEAGWVATSLDGITWQKINLR